MAPVVRKLKTIELSIGAVQYECQITAWNVQNNSADPERLYTQCPTGEVLDEMTPDWALELTWYEDFTVNGLSNFLQENDGEDAAFVLAHHPGVAGEEVSWSGTIRIKAPNVGGEVRTNLTQTQTFMCLGKPTYARAA